MSDLLVLVAVPGDAVADSPADDAPADVVWPWTSRGETAWAVRLHDELAERSSPPAPTDVARVASWLATQAVGRDTIIVREPRLAEFAGIWAAGARRAGVAETRLATAVGSTGQPVEADVTARGDGIDTPATSPGRAALKRATWRDRARLWVVDRAEDAGRLAVRALQR